GQAEDGDVGHLRAAGAHRREGLVARRVEERDPAAVRVHLVRADVLRDPAGLGRGDGRLADRVEERRLAVVDVAHDRHDRRARLELLLGIVVDLGLGLLFVGVLDDDLALDLGGDQLDLFVRERLRDLHHLAEAHHDLDDLRGRDAERLREVADGDARGYGHGAGGLDDRRRLLRLDLAALARALTPVLPRPAAALDDDAALLAGGALAGSDGSLWSVSHSSSSVEASQIGVDVDGAAQAAVEGPPRHRSLEAREPPASIGAPPRSGARLEDRIRRREAHELGLRRLPPAARARSDRGAHDAFGSPSSTSAAAATGSRCPVASGAGSRFASSWCAGTPQYFEPGSAAFGQRLPFERMAEHRPEKSSLSSPSPAYAAAASCC